MDLKKLLGEKKKIDPMEKEAKLNAIKDMRKAAGDMMTDGMKEKMSQVTVAAKDPEALEEGLETAKELVAETPEMESEDTQEEMEEMLASLDSPEKIDELMQKLAEKKAQLRSE